MLRIILVGICLFIFISCTSKTPEEQRRDWQKEYEQHYKAMLCMLMEVQVDIYEQNPSGRGYGFQGYASKWDHLESIYKSLPRAMKPPHSWDYPKTYIPDPAHIPFELVRQNCITIANKFIQIPY